MGRKKKPEEHVNHERWMVSYADFITLLFAFFVMMYSISIVNTGKFKVLSESLTAAFTDPARSLEPIQVGDLVRAPAEMQDQSFADPQPKPIRPVEMRQMAKLVDVDPVLLDKASKQLDEIQERVETAMAEMIDQGAITVQRSEYWIEIEMNSSVLFESGSSILYPRVVPILTQLGRVMIDFPNHVHVEGYTDTVPINTEMFPSNWELSGSRAATVVRLFEFTGVKPDRLAAIGYGEYYPVAENTNAEGRARNRRVVAVVLAEIGEKIDATIEKFEKAKNSGGPAG
ncbi:flagellar motor protein MotD [Pseudomonadales bacterium]|jgi:chemotaxis protein MotB|nr:flagellar motor protein MotD [Pseudomonadales bacterium]MDC3304760.1 flagellar motor protein MotD [bacterium]MDB4035530.1 flagellar motor protein MotD [Pseudomonadales bacterium]MDB9963063.1 flagellar motor protein MotD [Pseudomonadales bacterium]MDC1238881.1 flagellar motor protein MotD [Pseudomonadales bacterium]